MFYAIWWAPIGSMRTTKKIFDLRLNLAKIAILAVFGRSAKTALQKIATDGIGI